MRGWVNGRVLDSVEQPALSVVDHGLTVGDGVFETVKVVDGAPFALSRHLRRLARSAAGLGLSTPAESVLRAAVAAVLDGEPLPLGRLRITVTGGPSPLGSARGESDPTVVVVAGPLDAPAPSTAVVTVPWVRNERGALAGLKTTSYAENVVALAYAKNRGASEAVFANTRGELCEGTGSNVFYVRGGQLLTPTLRSGALAGVTRALVLAWGGGMARDWPIGVLAEADEIFLASTTRDVQPVHRCDDRELAAPGPVTREVLAAWSKRAAEDPDP